MSQNTKGLCIVSLFSGCGGLDYGLEAAGFNTSIALEMDHDCCETMRASRRWAVIEDDIFNVPTAKLLADGGIGRGVDLLVGGPPCQPFSKAGYWARGETLRLDDPRAGTLLAYMRVVAECLPRAFLLENVPGLAYKGKNEGLTLLLDRIREINARTGSQYEPTIQTLNAADYGVPQLRERVFMIASRDGTRFKFPEPVFSASGQHLPSHRTAWDAISDVKPDAEETLGVRGKWCDLLPTIPEGMNYLYHTDRGGGLPLFGWRRRYWSFLLKLAKTKPSWTIQASPGPASGPFHWKNRLLSIREMCRLQTFPDDVTVCGNRGSQQRQIGNAVPSLLAEVLGKEIGRQLLGVAPTPGFRLLPALRLPVPPPEALAAVPTKFMSLVGTHAAHRGTGKGFRASKSHIGGLVSYGQTGQRKAP